MAKKKEKSRKPEQEGMSAALWLVPILAILDLLYYFLLSMGAPLPTFGIGIDKWKIGSAIFQGALLVVLALSHALDRRAPAAECEAEEVEPEEVEELPKPKAVTKRPTAAATPAAPPARPVSPEPAPKAPARQVMEYPPKASGGIYADSHIPVGEGKFLKFRTLIARSCLLCDEQERCWDIIRHDVDEDSFKSNIDCKQGLKIES